MRPFFFFLSQLIKEGEDFLLKNGTFKESRGFGPFQSKPFRGPHKKRGSYKKRPYGGNSSQAVTSRFPLARETKLQRLQGSFLTPQ